MITREGLFLQTGIIGLILLPDVTFPSDSGVFLPQSAMEVIPSRLCTRSYGCIVGTANPGEKLESVTFSLRSVLSA